MPKTYWISLWHFLSEYTPNQNDFGLHKKDEMRGAKKKSKKILRILLQMEKSLQAKLPNTASSGWVDDYDKETRLLKETWSLVLLIVKPIGAVRAHAFSKRAAANLMDQTNSSY
jgi:hypothetical protein